MPASTASGLISGKAGSGRLLSLASARSLPSWTSGGAVDDVVDRAGQQTLDRRRAAIERNVLHVEPGLAIEQIAGKPRRDDPRAIVELAGTALAARDQLFHRPRAVLGAYAHERRVLGRKRDRGELLEGVIS
jgi:hypothetical protein